MRGNGCLCQDLRMRHLLLACALGAALWIPLSGRTSTDTPLETAALAWDRGDYVSALTTYLELLGGSPTPETIEAIVVWTDGTSECPASFSSRYTFSGAIVMPSPVQEYAFVVPV